MQKVTLEINNSVYDYIMFFLENIPKNLINIKKGLQKAVPKNPKKSSFFENKKLPDGFFKPLEIDSYKNIATRDEIYEK